MKKQLVVLVAILSVLAVLLGSPLTDRTMASEIGKDVRVAADIIVSTDWLQKNKELVQVIDARKKGFDEEHIPGAVHMPYTQLNDPKHPVEDYLISKKDFERKMKTIGVRNDQTVVVYDDGRSPYAARLFFALDYYGHEDVRLLDGGLTAWTESGKELAHDVDEYKKGNFKASLKENLLVDKDFVKNAIGKEGVVLLDVRSPEEYRGEDKRAKRGGHIPTAVNLEWKNTINPEGIPNLKPLYQLEQQFEELGVTKDKTIIIYCHTALRTSHTYVVLRLLGFENLHVYEGSWAEWGNDRDMPIDKP
ncbi:sulfurtransferase [Alkalihalobacterium sp. APHAB7]|uniref:sulfurtransferase n=1 Tax=Alkalihalobacterium sp. APHAB7 TaxID=3402081 RepID=UPI003AADA5A2